jgi:hypothetical protein
MGVCQNGYRLRVSIHESADLAAAEGYWAALLGVETSAFSRATIKRHRPKTGRYNTGASYYGCLTIDVLKSAELYRFVEGWWRGVATGLDGSTTE